MFCMPHLRLVCSGMATLPPRSAPLPANQPLESLPSESQPLSRPPRTPVLLGRRKLPLRFSEVQPSRSDTPYTWVTRLGSRKPSTKYRSSRGWGKVWSLYICRLCLHPRVTCVPDQWNLLSSLLSLSSSLLSLLSAFPFISTTIH